MKLDFRNALQVILAKRFRHAGVGLGYSIKIHNGVVAASILSEYLQTSQERLADFCSASYCFGCSQIFSELADPLRD